MDRLLSAISPLQIVLDQLRSLLRSALQLLPNLAAAVVLLLITAVVAYFVARAGESLMRRSRRRPSLVAAVGTLLRLAVWFFGLMLAATVVFPNLTPTKLLAGLGIGSIAVGLAFKDIFENFLAGFLMMLRKPMRIGDDIACGDISGRVEDIRIRDTFIRRRSGELLLVPNSFLFKNPVEVLTDRPERRIELIVGVAYGEDVDTARKTIFDAVDGLSSRVQDRKVDVFAQTFNSSSIDFRVRWWCKSPPPEEHRTRDEAVGAIKRALDDAGIEIPFPYRTLTFKEPLRVFAPEDPESSVADEGGAEDDRPRQSQGRQQTG